MPLTPTDPTKPQVWITGQAPNQILDFYIPQGPKGDPGGITLGTQLNGQSNLNEYKTSGVYRLGTTYSGLLLLNFPRDTDSGVLVVLERVGNQTLVQEWHSMQLQGKGFYIRHMTNTDIWSTWRFIAGSRVDQSAGRAIYQWDDLNNRDQLVYGSTGVRDISSMVDSTYYTMPGGVPSGYAAYVRRNGNNVHLSLRVTVVAANASGVVMFTLPAGFRADITVTAIGLLEGGTATPVACQVTPTGGFRVWHSGASGVLTVNLPYTTLDAWPTTLPGIFAGSIPNA